MNYKIAFFLGALNRGGAETLLADVFGQRASLPFEAVCIYRKEGSMSEAFHATDVPMLRVARKRSWIAFGIRFRRQVLKQNVDIVHAQTAFNAALAIVFLAFTRIKVVTTLHGFGFVKAHPLYKRFVFRNSRRIIFVSESERAEYCKHGIYGEEDRFVVVQNGINFSKFGYCQPPNLADPRVKMCMVGSFGEGRNHLFVCKFLNALKEKGIPFYFTFIGAARSSEQSIYDNCVSYCHAHGLDDMVAFYGLSNDVPGMLRGMDAFVYCTRHDSFGIAVIESIATGLPTFVNATDVMQEITNQGQDAALYPTDDVDALVSKFEEYVSHRQESWQKAQECAHSVRQRYSIERHIASLSAVYQSV